MMKNYWGGFREEVRALFQNTFIETLESLIENTISSISDTSNVFVKSVKLLWVTSLILVLVIVLFFKRVWRLIRRVAIITIQEINIYIAVLAKLSKDLHEKWENVLIVFLDIQKYLIRKIRDDNTSFETSYDGKYGELLFWEFPSINILWLLWLLVSLIMVTLLAVSSLVMFPVLHMIVRVAFMPKSER